MMIHNFARCPDDFFNLTQYNNIPNTTKLLYHPKG